MKTKDKKQIKKGLSNSEKLNKARKVYTNPQNANKQNTFSTFIKKNIWIILILILTVLIYLNAIKNGFVNWDDNNYIHNNPYIKGLSISNLKDIFTKSYFANYHPLTTLTYAIEYSLFKLNPLPYHFFNISLHLINTLLVFLFIKNITKRVEVPLITTLLFAVHPMHVESVAWIAERKDVLYTMFFLLSLIYYIKYQKDNKNIKYLIITFILFVASLMSKSAAVTLPLIILLLSYYINKRIIIKDWLYSIPFFILSLIFGFIAIRTQKDAIGSVNVNEMYNIYQRVLLVCFALYFYIIRFIVPYGFSAIHPYPFTENMSLPTEYYFAPILLIVLIFIIFISKKELKSILLFGFVFFIITISLIIQLMPFGDAIVSERYTYIPYIGLSFITANIIILLLKKNNRILLIFLSVSYLLFLTISTIEQIKIWNNSEILWTKSIASNPKSYISYYSRGAARSEVGNYKDAYDDYNTAISINPKYALPYNNRGLIKLKNNDINGAIEDYCKAISLDSKYANAYNNRGHALALSGKMDEAYNDFNKAIQIDSNYVDAYSNRGNVLRLTGKLDEALVDYNKAIQINSNYYNAYENIASLYYNKGEYKQALKYYEKVVEIVPEYAHGYYNLASTKNNLNDLNGACSDWHTALKLGDESAMQMIQMHCH